MRHTIILKVLTASFFFTVLTKDSLAEGKPFEKFSFRNTSMDAIRDTVPVPQKETAENTAGSKKEEKIKILPKPRRQPVPVPVNVKIVPVIKPIIRPVIKPVIKILH
ncbi:MAG: hypothetical protein J0H55_16015 [Chitinophagaceae bacterium]|nr:hypothetical protein [Chitinophagaceae bacterium]